MQVRKEEQEDPEKSSIAVIADTACRGIGPAMGTAVLVLSLLDQIGAQSAVVMLGIGPAWHWHR